MLLNRPIIILTFVNTTLVLFFRPIMVEIHGVTVLGTLLLGLL